MADPIITEADRDAGFDLCPIYQPHERGAPCRECKRLALALATARAEGRRAGMEEAARVVADAEAVLEIIADGEGWRTGNMARAKAWIANHGRRARTTKEGTDVSAG